MQLGGKMEKLQKGEILTLENNEEYTLLEIIEQDVNYLYLINDESDVIIAKEFIEKDELYIDVIDDKEKIAEIAEIVIKRLSN